LPKIGIYTYRSATRQTAAPAIRHRSRTDGSPYGKAPCPRRIERRRKSGQPPLRSALVPDGDLLREGGIFIFERSDDKDSSDHIFLQSADYEPYIFLYSKKIEK
jgi:hypothetical protein